MKSDQHKDPIRFCYDRHEGIQPAILDQIRRLIIKGGGVGTKLIPENLQNAFLIGYAIDPSDRVLGTVTLKRPKAEYRLKIEEVTGLDLSGYLERGYTSIEKGFSGGVIADSLIKGLIERSENRKIYTTIRMDNHGALKLTRKNGMRLAATFKNWRTGREIGLFVNEPGRKDHSLSGG